MIFPFIGPLPDIQAELSAYTSEYAQTDDTPCISASGDDICAIHAVGGRVCAANWVPLGTVLHVKSEGFDVECVVLDRMNRRYPRNVDVYFGQDIAAARTFGRRAGSVIIKLMP